MSTNENTAAAASVEELAAQIIAAARALGLDAEAADIDLRCQLGGRRGRWVASLRRWSVGSDEGPSCALAALLGAVEGER